MDENNKCYPVSNDENITICNHNDGIGYCGRYNKKCDNQQRKLKPEEQEECPDCDGEGRTSNNEPAERDTCQRCSGSGKIKRKKQDNA